LRGTNLFEVIKFIRKKNIFQISGVSGSILLMVREEISASLTRSSWFCHVKLPKGGRKQRVLFRGIEKARKP